MTAVVQTVKASYIASTKYRNRSGNKEVRLTFKIEIKINKIVCLFVQPIVQWKMRLPGKKPLILNERQNEFDSQARKSAAMKKRLEPIHLLSQFQNQKYECYLSDLIWNFLCRLLNAIFFVCFFF